MLRAVPWMLAAVACSSPGSLWGPGGMTRLRTASYALGIRDGQPEMTILLSNGFLDCSTPVWGASDVAAAVAAETTALCREGAQHVILSVLDPQGTWVGEFPALARDADTPRRVSGAYYAVDEAVLTEVNELDRTYLSLEDTFFPSLSPGTVGLDPASTPGRGGSTCEHGLGRVRGWLSFPQHDLSGRFVASACGCNDKSTLEVLDACLPFRCERVDGIGCE